MSCKEIFELFKNMGGKMECNYITKKCRLTNRNASENTVIPQNLSCDITTHDAISNLEELISDIGLKPYVSTHHISTPMCNVSIDRLHKFHIKNTNGIILEFKKDNKEWYNTISSSSE